jgi:D-xylose transport system ATP-binding protein
MSKVHNNAPVLEVKNVSKSFGKIQALKNVSMEIFQGEVVGLLGDNGAGKSTLIKIISGNYHADKGEVYLNGERLESDSPAEAHAAGIETVYQNSPICENATVSANFFIGRELYRRVSGIRILKERAMHEETIEVLSEIGINIPAAKAKMGLLSGGQRQAIVLGRFFHWGGKIALLDEPFAALGVAESRNGLKLIRQVSERGLPIILITHNIEYAFEVINRFVVLRHGEVVGMGRREDVTISDVVSMITGAIHMQS